MQRNFGWVFVCLEWAPNGKPPSIRATYSDNSPMDYGDPVRGKTPVGKNTKFLSKIMAVTKIGYAAGMIMDCE